MRAYLKLVWLSLDGLSGSIAEHSAAVDAAQAKFDTVRALRDAAVEAAREARRALPDLEKRERAAQAAVTQYEADMARETAQKSAALRAAKIYRLKLKACVSSY